MNFTVIMIELTVMFLIFGFLAFGLLLISPLTFISDYPPEIQNAYYRTQNKEATKQRLNAIMMIKKIVALIAYMFLFAWMLHIAGAKTFVQGLFLTYTYVMALFAWDTFFIDWVLFANIKKIRLPGTEHMDKEYHQKWFHVKACLPMIPVFAVMGVLSSLIMLWIW
jgi:hypothetical protein